MPPFSLSSSGECQPRLTAVALVCACCLLGVSPCRAEEAVIRAGISLEVRLSTPISSRQSKPGDRVSGTIIAPVLAEDRQVLLANATISGSIEHVQRLGFGLKHEIARLAFRFDSLTLSDGQRFPILTRIRKIEDARERVDQMGNVDGILPVANVSSGISFAISTLLLHTGLTAPAAIVKVVIARSPDSEIYLPAGTELLVQLESSLSMNLPQSVGQTTPPLSDGDRHRVEQLLATVPVQQTMSGRMQHSDLVNVLLLGTAKQVNTAFQRADWTGENRRGVLALFRMYHGLVQRMGYSNLPMAPLTLNGVRATRTYQKSLNTIAKRHHVRLWNQFEPDAWLGAATEDIGYRVRDMHVTHAIDLSIDNERAKVVNDLWFSGCVQAASLLPRRSLQVADDGVSPLMTDGDIAVLRLKTCDAALPAAQHPTRLTRAVEALEAVGLDTVRANPFTVGLLVSRSVAMHCRRSDRTDPSVVNAQTWQRPIAIEVAPLPAVQQPVPSGGANDFSQVRCNITPPK